MLSSLKNDYSVHLFDAKFKCSNAGIAAQADPGALMATIGTYIEKIALPEGTFKAELELKLLFYTNLGARMTKEFNLRYPVVGYDI